MRQIAIEQAIFEVARKLEFGEAREAYLRRACGDDPEVSRRTRALLEAYLLHPNFLERPSYVVTSTPSEPVDGPVASKAGDTRIGPYRVLEKIGEGGMGVVYKAEQVWPFKREVALKLIKPGMDSHQVIARFEAERQVLALMDHANIAKVFDAGTFSTGQPAEQVDHPGTSSVPNTDATRLLDPNVRPYFVMELVRGVPIIEFCDQHKFDAWTRLKLFVTVCQAVQHAHRKGVIHRDLKPGNVLVELRDDAAVPKIIDFGVAKAIHQPLTERALFTNVNQMIGTPLYMSPEQAQLNALDIDTRSDIYSLGVLLYELLTGTTPFESATLKNAGYEEMRRIIQEIEPSSPSHRLSTLAAGTLTTISANRAVDGRKLRQQIRGELDWIVMKCLEKDRSRRYESVSDLAADVQHYLDDLPVQASPPDFLYRLGKFVRRNRAAVVSTALVLAAVLLGSGVSIWKYLGERDARREFERQRNIAVQGQQDLREYLYASDIHVAMDAVASGYPAKARPLLDRHIPRVGEHDLRGFAWHFLNYWIQQSEQASRESLVIRGHNEDVYFVKTSPDGKIVASAGKDHSVGLWDAKTGEHLRTLSGHTNEVNSVAFAPDGKTIATASDDRTVRVWSVATGTENWSIADFALIVVRVQFSPNGETLAATEADLEANDGKTTVWNVTSRTKICQWEHQLILAFHPHVSLVATFTRDNDILLVDPITNQLRAKLNGHHKPATSGAFTQDGKRLITCDESAMVIVWNVETAREMARFHSQDARPRSICLSPDDRFVAVAGKHGVVRIFHLASGELYRVIDYSQPTIWSVDFSKDGQYVFAGCADGTIRRSPSRIRSASLTLPETPNACRAVVSPDGQRLAVVDTSPTANLWRLPEGVLERKIEISAADPESLFQAASLSVGDHQLILVDNRGSVHVVDLRSGQEISVWKAHDGGMTQFTDSPRGKGFVSSFMGNIRVWNERHEILREISNIEPAYAAHLSPNGTLLVAVTSYGLRSWDIASGRLRDDLRVNKSLILTGAFSSGGKFFATGHQDMSITIWDGNLQHEIRTLYGHTGALSCLAFLPDEKTLVSGSSTGEVKLWDLTTGQELFDLAGHTGAIRWIDSSRDGQVLVTSGQSRHGHGEVWVWSAPRLESDGVTTGK